VPTKQIVDVPKFGKWFAIREKVNVDRIYIAGVSTDCCVLSTALEAVDDGIEVFIIEDACAGSSQEAHVDALKIMKGYYPNLKIINSKDLPF
jgi:nicotinamidase-related amidase